MWYHIDQGKKKKVYMTPILHYIEIFLITGGGTKNISSSTQMEVVDEDLPFNNESSTVNEN